MRDHEPSEAAPLLARTTSQRLYARFSTQRKRAILALVSSSGLVSLFVAGSFIPAIPQVVEDLNSTPAVISQSVGVFIVSAALGNLIWAKYSSYYGRRPIYLAALTLLFAGSIGVGMARSAPELLAWRFVQAFGAATDIVGPGVVGDIYARAKRGGALGVFFGACQVGPALAPLLGGALAHWASWRLTQLLIAGAAAVLFAAVYMTLPETYPPGRRGVDLAGQRVPALNIFGCFWMLRSPGLLLTALASTTVLFTDYVLCVPLAFTIGDAYGITNAAAIGAFFLPVGLGNALGAPLAGWLSDRLQPDADAATDDGADGAEWAPEDRLRAALGPALLLVPGSALGAGLAVQYVRGAPGIALTLLMFFVHGLGSMMVLSLTGTYAVDCVKDRSAEITAANAALRAGLIALAALGVQPLLEHAGVALTDAVSGAIALVGAGMLVVVVRYGRRMREMVDVGYSKDDV